MAEVTARCGNWSAKLGDPRLVECLIASLSYRLEPDGFGSRFPVLLTEALAGRLEPERASAAWQELETASREARALPTEKAVDSLEHRRPVDLSALPAGAADNLYELFRTPDGREMLAVIGEGIQVSHAQGQPLVIRTGRTTRRLWQGVFFAVVGLAGAAWAYLTLPDVIVGPRNWSSARGTASHGAPLWTWIAILGAAGLGEMAKALVPRLSILVEKNFWAFRVLAAVACMAWLMYWWR